MVFTQQGGGMTSVEDSESEFRGVEVEPGESVMNAKDIDHFKDEVVISVNTVISPCILCLFLCSFLLHLLVMEIGMA